MPNRIVRDAILSSERVASLGWPEEVFYRRLMSIVDDFGRYEANPQLLRSRCYPLQTDNVRAADISRWMAACQKAGLILGYEVAGKQYLEVLNFGQQQRSASKFPPPPPVDINCYQPPSDAHLDVSVFGDVSEDGDDTRKRAKPAGFSLPDWINRAHWDAWHSCPKRKKATDAQKQLAVEKLDGWRQAGEDYAAALENAAVGGWQGLFLPDKAKPNPADIRTATVPAKPGKDPTLLRLEADARNAAPAPQSVGDLLAKLKTTGATQ